MTGFLNLFFNGETESRTPFVKNLLGASVPPELNPIFGPHCQAEKIKDFLVKWPVDFKPIFKTDFFGGVQISRQRRTKHRQMSWAAHTTCTAFPISVRTSGTHIARGTGANGPRFGVRPVVTLGVIFYIRFRLPSVTVVALLQELSWS